jgi:hypothetical protein
VQKVGVQEHGSKDVLERRVGGDESIVPNDTLKGYPGGGFKENVAVNDDE